MPDGLWPASHNLGVRPGPGRATGKSCYLHFLPEVLPTGQKLVQRALGMLHAAAVLPIDQEPGGAQEQAYGTQV